MTDPPRQPDQMGVQFGEIPAKPQHPSGPQFLQAIGLLVYRWGTFEQVLDIVQHIGINVSHRFGYPEEAQVSLKKKVRLIKLIFRRTSVLNQYNAAVSELMKQIKLASARRHDVIHSSIAGIRSQSDPPILVLHASRLRKGKTYSRTIDLSLADLDDLCNEIDHLTTHVMEVSFILMQFQERDDKSGTDALLKIAEVRRKTPTPE
jgi:hypothetical protein